METSIRNLKGRFDGCRGGGGGGMSVRHHLKSRARSPPVPLPMNMPIQDEILNKCLSQRKLKIPVF